MVPSRNAVPAHPVDTEAPVGKQETKIKGRRAITTRSSVFGCFILELRHRVVAAFRERIASNYPLGSHPATTDKPIFLDGLKCIL